MNSETLPLPPEIETCVIGSGFGGLSIAASLQAAGADYLALDKGRTPGGRAATRRFADSRFDHGLPFLTEKGALTRELIERGEAAGLLRRMERFDGENDGWYSPAGISALGKHLARGLNVRNAAKVTSIEAEGEGLRLAVELGDVNGTVMVRRNLILTAPIPQSLELLAPFSPDWQGLDAPPYREEIVAMVRVDPDRMAAGPALQTVESGNGTVVRDYLKFTDVEPGLSFRFSPALSSELFEREESEIVAAALDEIETLAGPGPSGMVQLMKWRYANGAGAVSRPYLETTAAGVCVRVCGDAFLAGEADGTEATLLSCRSALESLG